MKKHAAAAAAAAVLASMVMSAGASAHEGSESEEGGLEVELRPAIVDVGELVVVEAEYEAEDDEGEDDGTSEDDSTEDDSTDEGSTEEEGTSDGGETDDVAASETGAGTTEFVVDFGDGSAPVTMTADADEDEEAAHATHQYASDGMYTVAVTATPATGTPVQTSVVVKVGAGSARLAGDDRYATAERLSREDFPADNSASAVLLARSDGFADALASASLAVLEDAPVLLTTGDTVPVSVLDEIGRALVPGGTVYLLGGEAAIGESVADALRAQGHEVVRIAGSDRIATGVAIAEFLLASGVEIDEVVVANGANFPDALSGAAFAAAFDAPVLLTGADALDSRVADLLGRLDPGTEVLVAGGVAAVSDAVVAELVELGFEVERISGEDRYETSAEVAERLFPSATEVVLATGANFPDALAGAAMAGRSGAPVLLVGDTLPDAVRDYLADRAGQITRVYALGGDRAIPAAVLAEVEAILGL